MSKKEAATGFLKMVAARNVREAYDKYIAPNFIHHNQFFKGDRQALLSAMEKAAQANPGKIVDIKRTLEDGDFVMTLSHIKQNGPDPGGAVVHLFRFENDKVVELWDLGQPIMQDSPNENGVF